ncbi:MAG: CoA transferase, partial [Herbiconiux sp.]|nr:CoA transferase [Herbiconiux sp.]
INPRIIVSESSAFGRHGPWSDRMGYGPLVRASSGLSLTWQYPGVDFGFSDTITIYPDHVAARVSASAVAALLRRRERTGRGGHVSSAQIDVIFSSMAEQLAVERAHPGTIRAEGNRRGVDAPTGPYQAAGDDEWVVVDVRDTPEFRALATAIGHPEWNDDASLATRDGRLARATELEHALAAWTRLHTPTEVERTLQTAGVPAGRMVRVVDLEHDEHCAGRGLLGALPQPQFAEPLTTFLAEARSTSGLSPLLTAAPLQGEHTVEIAVELLDLEPDQIDALVAEGVLQPHRARATTTAGV